MDEFIITGGKALSGEVTLNGAKNVALKVLVASLLTDEELVIGNVPRIRDVFVMLELLKTLGVMYTFRSSTVRIRNSGIHNTKVPLEVGACLRTSSMVIGPLLARKGNAVVPNPGGCRLGARPIDRHIDALTAMGVLSTYNSNDGFFYLRAKQLKGVHIKFSKNTHTGTETLILAAVLAKGKTVLSNAAEEVEVDELISFLNLMGAKIVRTGHRQITIHGVRSLHGARYTVMSDRNEEVTFALAAAITRGNVIVHKSQRNTLAPFLEKFTEAGAKYECIDETTTRYSCTVVPHATHIQTAPHPGFMTDWQAPWAVFMTQAKGTSIIHETIFERRFSYIEELIKMGALIRYFDHNVVKPESYYNFNWNDRTINSHHAITIVGPTVLHNAVLTISDLRAGATLILAALVAKGESYIYGAEQVDRGYASIERKLRKLGVHVTRVKEEA